MSAVVERDDCPTHGAFEVREFRLPVPGAKAIRLGCPQCAREQHEAEEEARQAAEIEQVRRRSRIPGLYLAMTLDGYPADLPQQRSAIGVCRGWLNRYPVLRSSAERGSWLVFSGPVGTGKTGMACAVADELMRVGRSVVYHTPSSLRQWCWDAKHRGSCEADAVHALVWCELLVIDELAANKPSEAELSLLSDVLDRRYMDGRPVILITNRTRGELSSHLPERLVDRIEQRAGWVVCNWPSLRRR